MIDAAHLNRIFYPQSIALVGASNQFGKWGNILLTNLIAGNYKGAIYPVNATEDRVVGLPCHRSLMDLPSAPDLVVIATPAATVMDIFRDMATLKIPGAVVITSGFGETGADGARLEAELVEFARAHDIRFIGPNTMGIQNANHSLSITATHSRPRPGRAALIAQSGNLGSQLLDWAAREGIGLGIYIGSGNQADLGGVELLDYLAQDANTDVILYYLEGVQDGRAFLEQAKTITPRKPIIMLKGGRSDLGGRAASSHTGALAGSSRMYQALCRQSGMVWADSSMELLDLSAAFSYLPLPKGNRVGITTLGGGWGVVTTDACVDAGLDVPPLPEEVVKVIDKVLPPFWSRNNPVDLVGTRDINAMLVTLEELVKWDGCDAVITLGVLGRHVLVDAMVESSRIASPDVGEEFWTFAGAMVHQHDLQYRDAIVELMNRYGKPIIGVTLLEDGTGTVFGPQDVRYHGVAFPTPERAVAALARMLGYQRHLDRLHGCSSSS